MQVNKKVALALVLTALLSATIAAYSAIQYIHYIENQASVIAVYGVKVVLDVEPYDIEVASIDWGNLPPASTKSSIEILGAKCRLKNQDNMDIWAWWRLDPLTSLPDGVTLTAYKWYGANPDEWAQGPGGSTSLLIPTGTVYMDCSIEWRLTIASGTPPADFSFTIDVVASDVQGG